MRAALLFIAAAVVGTAFSDHLDTDDSVARAAFESAIRRWQREQDEVYYNPSVGEAYDEVRAADDPSIVINVRRGVTVATSGSPATSTTAAPAPPLDAGSDELAGNQGPHIVIPAGGESLLFTCMNDASALCASENVFTVLQCMIARASKVTPKCFDLLRGYVHCAQGAQPLCPAEKGAVVAASPLNLQPVVLCLASMNAEAESSLHDRQCRGSAFFKYVRAANNDDVSADSTAERAAWPNVSQWLARVRRRPGGGIGHLARQGREYPSFRAACEADAETLCQSNNPFAASECLQEHLSELRPLCREYQAAKRQCYADLDAAKIDCAKGVSKFQCLGQHFDHENLSRECRESRFGQYMQLRLERKAQKDVEKGSTGGNAESTDAPVADTSRL